MGAGQSSTPKRLTPQPEDIAEFRKLQGQTDHYIIPEVPEKREVTDIKFLVAFGVVIVMLVPFLIYTLHYSDADRYFHGYDNCGNVCGKENDLVDGINCRRENKTSTPYLRWKKNGNYHGHKDKDEDEYISDKCVKNCGSGYDQFMYHCFPSDESERIDFNKVFSEIADDINKSAGHIVALCFIGLGFSIGMLVLFRYFVAVVVWVIIIGSLLALIAMAGFFWYLDSQIRQEGATFFKILAVVFSVVSLILIIVLFCMFKRIQLVIRLFKEAIKVIFGIPLILFEPLLTFVSSSIVLCMFFYILFLIQNSGILQEVEASRYEYVLNAVMVFTLWYHVVICLWMAQFIAGCQHMVVSGAVSAYYFARDKSTVVSPIYNSLYNLVRYHLGTVAFGSLIITVTTIIKELVKSLADSKQAKVLVECCLGALEDFLKYLSKNAYIQTAMHGRSFFKSGKRAVRLLAANALSVVAINSVGDFVLGMAKLLIVICTIGAGILMGKSTDIKHFWAAIVISAFVTAIIAGCFFDVFETAIDTIFLCFCEDCCMNDGMARPYYMSVKLIQYVEDAKKAVKEKK